MMMMDIILKPPFFFPSLFKTGESSVIRTDGPPLRRCHAVQLFVLLFKDLEEQVLLEILIVPGA